MRIGDRVAVVPIDGNRATALTNLERYDEAERLYERVSRFYGELGKPLFVLQTAYNHAVREALRDPAAPERTGDAASR